MYKYNINFSSFTYFLFLLIFLFFIFWTDEALAVVTSDGLLDNLLDRYERTARSWATRLQDAAQFIFWTLVLISMVWTFGMMALRQADIGEFFAELIRFTIFTGFYLWLLLNGPAMAEAIMDGLRDLGRDAGGLNYDVSPSGIIDIGWSILFDSLRSGGFIGSLFNPLEKAGIMVLAFVFLGVTALIAVNMMLLLITQWILAFAGIFILGFGGSRWTSDMAINYYKTVLGTGLQLMTMVLLVGIGSAFLTDQAANIGEHSLEELAIMAISSLMLLFLVDKVPPVISGLVTGAGIGSLGVGSFGAGAAIGAASAAGGMMAAGASMAANAGTTVATQAAGGASAISAALASAQQHFNAGTDIGTNAARSIAGVSSADRVELPGGYPNLSKNDSGGIQGGGSEDTQTEGTQSEDTVADATQTQTDGTESGGSQDSGEAGAGGAQGSGQAGAGGAQGSGQAGTGGAQGSGQAGAGGAQGSGQAGAGGAQGSGQAGVDGAQGSGQVGAGGAQGSGQAGTGGAQGSSSGRKPLNYGNASAIGSLAKGFLTDTARRDPMIKAGLIGTDAAYNLAQGAKKVVADKMGDVASNLGEKVSQTTGGQIAQAIKAADVKNNPMFGDENLIAAGLDPKSTELDKEAEAAAFVNRPGRNKSS